MMVMFSIMPVLTITGYASVILVCVRAAVDCGRNVPTSTATIS